MKKGENGLSIAESRHATLEFDFKTFSAVMLSVWQQSDCRYSFEDALKVFYIFFYNYEIYFGFPHPPIRKSQILSILSVMDAVEDDLGRSLDLEPEDYSYLIPLYFDTDFRCCDYRINHFFSGKIRLMRYYEHECGY